MLTIKYKIITTHVALDYDSDDEALYRDIVKHKCFRLNDNYILTKNIICLINIIENPTHTLILNDNHNALDVSITGVLPSDIWENDYILIDNGIVRTKDIHAIIKK